MFMDLLNLGAWIFVILCALVAVMWVLSIPILLIERIIADFKKQKAAKRAGPRYD
jgi:hypothetical protein